MPAIHAQVTVGSNKEPETFSALELISNEKAGLRMPLLTTVERNAMEATYKSNPDKNALAKGLTIYNTTNNCIEFWNGEKWISTCGGEVPPYIPAPIDGNCYAFGCAEYMFTYQTMTLVAGYNTLPQPTSYQWVIDGKVIPDAIDATYAFNPVEAGIELEEDELGNWKKVVPVTCQMEIDGEMKEAAASEILIVKATKGVLSPIYVYAWDETGTKKVKATFAHVNLGAEDETNPCDNMKGYLYQWGRWSDDHQLRNSEAWPLSGDADDGTIAQYNDDNVLSDLDVNGQVKEGNDRYGKFIKHKVLSQEPEKQYGDWRSTRKDNLWGDGTDNYNQAKATPSDPCPSGWKVPSQKQIGAIFKGGLTSGESTTATANTWKLTDNIGPIKTRGYKVAEALYLPMAGTKEYNVGVPSLENGNGRYWSSTISFDAARYLSFYVKDVYAGNTIHRAQGASVRCIQE
ncbi:hypothetical protein D0T84_14395 [Dysgonomonas sp. 521]|nr:hypothetical protein [Dysgonomonas sp. 521]